MQGFGLPHKPGLFLAQTRNGSGVNRGRFLRQAVFFSDPFQARKITVEGETAAERGSSRHEVAAAHFWFSVDTLGAVFPPASSKGVSP